MSKVGGQQYEPNQNHEDKVKPKREQQQGGGPKQGGRKANKSCHVNCTNCSDPFTQPSWIRIYKQYIQSN